MAIYNAIDESLYSRQLYVLGNTAMQDLSESAVFLYGLGGLGIEIAKNLVLMGVKHLTICDDETVSNCDLGQNCFLSLEDVMQKSNRASASYSHLQELNPYVIVEAIINPFSEMEEFTDNFLHKYQCIILTDILDLDFVVKIDLACRKHSPPIKFIWSGVVGIACWAFCDFGNEFDVIDPDGEEAKEILIGRINKGDELLVITNDDVKHGLKTGDQVLFGDIVGMEQINGKTYTVSVVTPTSFTIRDGILIEGTYERGGFFKQLKKPVTICFESLEDQLQHPNYETVDYSKELAPNTIHLALLALHRYIQDHGEIPNIRSIHNAKRFIQLAEEINLQLPLPTKELDYDLLQKISFTARGHLCCLSSLLGGIVSQEVIKSVTRKFTPLQQWVLLDAREVTEADENCPPELFMNRGDRYDSLRICIGQYTLNHLADANLFMVGCGAIGCEMLKNYALLGVAANQGKITMTDNDLIEKSNLCRQFLFRMHHIRQPKSVVAAQAAHDINKDINFEVHQNKVWQETESIYTDAFFKNQSIIVNALDNVESRRYMDTRCIQSGRSLLESGTMGCKGHVQVILPHCTETYSSQSDPPEEEYPFCTIKSFPARVEHTVQWAREKFENLFHSKPFTVKKFQQNQSSLEELVQKLEGGECFENVAAISKSIPMLESRPCCYGDCIALARLKFQKYFNFKAKLLLHYFPLDHLLKDGTPFWQSPKRPPKPIDFNLDNSLHVLFITSMARILSAVWDIIVLPKELEPEFLIETLGKVQIPDFVPNTNKVIETEESAQKPTTTAWKENDVLALIDIIKKKKNELLSVAILPQAFEKDDDTNSHVDFIYATASLRGIMYGLEPETKLQVKRIAGSIIPAIASTTAAVAALVSLELLKVVKGLKERSAFKNSFLNLALPNVIMSEPAPPQVQSLQPGMTFTIWDQWYIDGRPDMLLEEFLETLKVKTGLNPSMVLEGSKIIWLPMLFGHHKKNKQTMLSLLNPEEMQDSCYLSVTYEGKPDDLMGPPVRYYFKKIV